MINVMETSISTPKRGRPVKPPAPPNDAVRELREKMGITQEEMARDLHCSLSAVRRFERERVVPSSGALRTNFEKLASKATTK